jgi:transcriptional regulator with XRE-family HTH domain
MAAGTVKDALAGRLRAARKAAGLTQVELARRVKSDQALLSRIERGEAVGRPELLRALARELKVTVSYLLGEDASDPAVRPTRDAISGDRKMPKGLRDLVDDETIIKAMKVTARDLKTLASIDLPGPIDKDAYVQLLVAVRAVSGGGRT